MAVQASKTSRPLNSLSLVEHLEGRRLLNGDVSGYVFYDVDRSGGDFSGVDVKGLPGIEVFLSTNGDDIKDSGEPTATTDNNGNFVFSNVPNGSYILQVTAPNLQRPTYPNNGNGRALTVNNGNVTGQNLGLVSTRGTAAGIVYQDNNNNGQYDQGTDAPLEYVRVYYDENNNNQFDDGTERFAFTDAGGNWHIGALENGNHHIGVSPGDQRTATAPQSGFHTVNISNYELDENLNFGLAPNNGGSHNQGKARGTVFIDANGNGIKDNGEGFAENFQVYVDVDSSGTLTQGDVVNYTNAQGQWQFEDLGNGSYTIRIEQGDGYVVTAPQNGWFNVTISSASDDFTLGAFGVSQNPNPGNSVISGKVFNDTNGNATQDQSETGRSGVTLYLDVNNNGSYQNGEPTAVTNGNGAYSFTGLSAGSYHVRVASLPAGQQLSSPGLGRYDINANGSNTSTGNDFGFAPVAAYVKNDFNGDGKTDLLFRDPATGVNTVWYMDDETRIGTAALPAIKDSNWVIGATGDFNGDGKTDLILQNNATGEHIAWFMNGVNRVSSTAFTAVGTQWRMNGAGDFNRDGKTDLVFRNTLTGAATVWYMNGVSLSSFGALPQVASQNWQIAGVEDFDADGDPDLLWTNATTKQNSLWLMNDRQVINDGFRGIRFPVAAGWRLAKVVSIDDDGRSALLWANDIDDTNSLWIVGNVSVKPVPVAFSRIAVSTPIPA